MLGSGVTPAVPTRCPGCLGGSLTVSKWERGDSEHGGGCGAAPPAAALRVPGWHLPLQRPGDRDTAAPAAPPLQRPAVLPPTSLRKGLNLRGVGDQRAATPRENFTEPSPESFDGGGLARAGNPRRDHGVPARSAVPRRHGHPPGPGARAEPGRGGAAPARSIARAQERWERFVLFFLSW